MSSSGQDASGGSSAGNLRERLRQQPGLTSADEDGKTVGTQLNAVETAKDARRLSREGSSGRAFGRTPDGTVFRVPETHDMVSQLFSPSEPKNLSDFILLLVLGFHISMLLWLSKSVRVPALALVYIFWRAGYNAGIGWLLYQQSHYKRLVSWARKSRIFENPKHGTNPHPRLYNFIKKELESKIPHDYNFDDAPLEYNTWLLFRRLTDLILLCDFVSYCVFAVACGGRPENESVILTIARWVGGLVLFLFNLWVKLDAHRVVKSFAWYWGDFFFLIDQELTFDGVFEMAPHPMYSVGYAGYYGISLMAASYKVLFISILGHAAQFVFLVLVENPHIDKTYSSPPPKKRVVLEQGAASYDDGEVPEGALSQGVTDEMPYPGKILVRGDIQPIFYVATFLILMHLALLALLTPSTTAYRVFFVSNALAWRMWFSLGISLILDRQSIKKSWTRLFIKYGETPGEAWRQWKLLYHLSLTMVHASFIAAALKMYTLPTDWTYGMTLLRHVIGLALIALQLWTALSIYDSLGEFGWYFGDFFFEAPGHTLTYSGIYRFLNNPERILGLVGLWGVALITWDPAIFFLALTSHTLALAFIQFVEQPHMQRRYGEQMREQSGLSKSIRRSMPPPLRVWQRSVDKIVDETMEFVEQVIESARPVVAKGVGSFVKDTSKLFHYPARISITRVAPDLAGVNPADYQLQVEGSESFASQQTQQQRSDRQGVDARGEQYRNDDMTAFKAIIFEYGTPIKVKWTAPANHARNDWIGLYMVSDNSSREITRISSQGRWVPTNKGQFDLEAGQESILVDDHPLDETGDMRGGEVMFEGDRLFWTTGVFEFRYHHAGKHNVMTISLPFEIRIPKFDEDDAEIDANGMFQTAVENKLLPMVRNCFDRDPDMAPTTPDENYGALILRDGKWAKRVVYGVHHMFGIEFAPEVVQADGSVRKLAWRICNAKKVLAPYSMSAGHGRSTPSGSK